MLCPNCDSENPDDARFCSSCGATLGLPPPPRGASRAPAPTSDGGMTWLVIGCVVVGVLGLVAVLAVTVAILFPVFGRAREKAVQTSCLSNVKQLSLANAMYCQDHGGHFPQAHDWCDRTYPYVRNQQVYVCPALPNSRAGYAFNAALDRGDLKAIKSPQGTGALFDARGGWNLSGGTNLADPRHNSGLNVGFADGHCKWMRPGNLGSVTWDPYAAAGGAAGTPPSGAATPRAAE